MQLFSGDKTLIMGVLNITPDSFHDGGKFFNREEAIRQAYKLRDEGADIIDIGGESTRPGASKISSSREIDRVCPVIEEIISDIGIPVSIDTYKADVAEEALKLGASIVNDISGLAFDGRMAGVIAEYGAYTVLMHIRGTPENMQTDPRYNDLLLEIYLYLEEAKNKAIDSGIKREKIIIDPGIGFGKTLKDNYTLLRNLGYFKKMGFPLLIGVSNKSLIGKLYEGDYNRLYATIALNSVSVLNGADIIRVHDVLPHRLALQSLEMLKKEKVVNGTCCN